MKDARFCLVPEAVFSPTEDGAVVPGCIEAVDQLKKKMITMFFKHLNSINPLVMYEAWL